MACHELTLSQNKNYPLQVKKRVVHGSASRTRTDDPLVTLIFGLLQRMDYITAMSRCIRDLGAPVSSLYGAPRQRRSSHGITHPAVARLGLHRYPRVFNPSFLGRLRNFRMYFPMTVRANQDAFIRLGFHFFKRTS